MITEIFHGTIDANADTVFATVGVNIAGRATFIVHNGLTVDGSVSKGTTFDLHPVSVPGHGYMPISISPGLWFSELAVEKPSEFHGTVVMDGVPNYTPMLDLVGIGNRAISWDLKGDMLRIFDASGSNKPFDSVHIEGPGGAPVSGLHVQSFTGNLLVSGGTETHGTISHVPA